MATKKLPNFLVNNELSKEDCTYPFEIEALDHFANHCLLDCFNLCMDLSNLQTSLGLSVLILW